MMKAEEEEYEGEAIMEIIIILLCMWRTTRDSGQMRPGKLQNGLQKHI